MKQRTAPAAKANPPIQANAITNAAPGGTPPSSLAVRIARPRSREEAEARYEAARDAWTAAMRAANTGRPADMASLAMAQEDYEAATAERERWIAGGRVAIPVEPETNRSGVEIAVDQELAWRDVRKNHDEGGVVGRIRRRLFGG
jgi:hypothetical protein